MNTYSRTITERLQASAQVKNSLALDADSMAGLAEITAVVVSCLRAGGTVFFCGNGGSATDSEHLSAELLGRFYREGCALPAYSLVSNTAAMTAIGNDYGYEWTFARQLSALARPGDVLVGLSTSGNSQNVIRAFEQAVESGVTTVSFTGSGGGKLAGQADYSFRAPSDDTPRIQECHMTVGHTICEIAESECRR